MIPKKIFVVVSVEDELPEKSGTYVVINPKLISPFDLMYNREENIWSNGKMNFKVETSGITHWLKEETEPQYTFSKSELEALLENAVNAYINSPTRQPAFTKQYIQSIIK